MNRLESRELREKRAVIANQMSELLNAAGVFKAPENQAKFEALDAEQRQLKEQIDRIERVSGLEHEMRATGRPPAGQPGSDDPDVTKKRENAHQAAFRSFLKHGMNPATTRMTAEERQLITELRDMGTAGQGAYPGITSGGGVFVPVGFVNRVEDAMKYYGPMLNGGQGMPEIMPTDSGQPLPFPTDNDTTISGELIGENQVVTSQDVTLGSVMLGAYKFSTKMVKVSMELLQDSAFDIEGFLIRKFAERTGRILNTKFTTGAGTTEPFGIVTQSTSGGTAVGANSNDGSSAANTIGSDDLTTLEHAVDILYRRNAHYMMHDSVLAAIKKVKDKYGRPLWMPGISVGAPDTINGYPYAPNNDMDQLQTAATSPTVTRKTLLFGSMEKYVIRRVKNMTVLRLEERFADYGQVAFIGFSRYDGALIDAGTHPVKYLQNVY